MKRLFACTIALSASTILADSPGRSPIQFKPLYEPGNGGAIVSLEISPHDPNLVISTGDMLGVATSFDGGKLWQSTFGFSSYEMGSLTFHPTDPDVVWTGSAMGPYVSRDRGIHWAAMRTGMPPISLHDYSVMIEKVLFDPDQPARLLAFSGSSRRWNTSDTFGYLWESTDDGKTWSHLTTLTDQGSLAGQKKGANVVWADYLPGSGAEIHALLDGGVWLKSTDDGKTWDNVTATGIVGPIQFVRFDPTQPSTVYVTTASFLPKGVPIRTPGGVFKSTDGGRTFRPHHDRYPHDRLGNGSEQRDAQQHLQSCRNFESQFEHAVRQRPRLEREHHLCQHRRGSYLDTCRRAKARRAGVLVRRPA